MAHVITIRKLMLHPLSSSGNFLRPNVWRVTANTMSLRALIWLLVINMPASMIFCCELKYQDLKLVIKYHTLVRKRIGKIKKGKIVRKRLTLKRILTVVLRQHDNHNESRKMGKTKTQYVPLSDQHLES